MKRKTKAVPAAPKPEPRPEPKAMTKDEFLALPLEEQQAILYDQIHAMQTWIANMRALAQVASR